MSNTNANNGYNSSASSDGRHINLPATDDNDSTEYSVPATDILPAYTTEITDQQINDRIIYPANQISIVILLQYIFTSILMPLIIRLIYNPIVLLYTFYQTNNHENQLDQQADEPGLYYFNLLINFFFRRNRNPPAHANDHAFTFSLTVALADDDDDEAFGIQDTQAHDYEILTSLNNYRRIYVMIMNENAHMNEDATLYENNADTILPDTVNTTNTRQSEVGGSEYSRHLLNSIASSDMAQSDDIIDQEDSNVSSDSDSGGDNLCDQNERRDAIVTNHENLDDAQNSLLSSNEATDIPKTVRSQSEGSMQTIENASRSTGINDSKRTPDIVSDSQSDRTNVN
ncbi:unnamed protein product [Rotaria magnacalcarata]|uniref:Uncharacterized protein n=1 Tax=Rotaria magnacalcarata TaxID=392030 RepID=A0A816ZFX0_9BILA|nr:unnamed protein product [Rotaria magnacalcarata]